MTIKKIFALTAGAAFMVAALAGHADAQGRGQAKGKSSAQSKGKEAKGKQAKGKEDKGKAVTPANPQDVMFKESDRPKFQQYFVAHKFVPEPLPPGILMNLERGKPLPPGIAKRVMPRDLLIYVPQAPNTNYYVIGDRVVAVRNGTIIDVLLNIFR